MTRRPASHSGRPPRLAVWLLAALLPDPDREHVIGDLLEDFRTSSRSGIAARAEFWRQALAALWTLGPWRPRAPHDRPTPRGDSTMQQLLIDVRHVARGVRKSPGFALVCALTLGLGIGSTAAMFGIVERIILRGPDHVVAPQRLMRFYTIERYAGTLSTESSHEYAAYTALRNRTHDFAGLGAYESSDWIVGTGAAARNLDGTAASADFFATLGVHPYLGRFYSAAEDEPGASRDVVVLAYDYWIRAFGGDRDAIGRTISIAFRPFTVIGVAPQGFTGAELAPVNYWIPLSAGDHPRPDWPTTWMAKWVQIVGRVKPGITPEQASTDATAAFRHAYTGLDPDEHKADVSVRPVSFTSAGEEPAVAQLSRWLTGVTIVVLLIACANIGNLLLARAVRRRGEIAVRLVLGMSRARLAQLLLAEGVLVAMLGGIVGIAVAYAAGNAIRRFFLADIAWSTPVIDGHVLATMIVLTAIVAVLVSLLPLAQSRHVDFSQALKSASREGGGRQERVRGGLLLLQTTLTGVLLVGAGLFVVSLAKARGVDLGIQTDKVIAVSVYWPTALADTALQAAAVVQRRLTTDRIRDSLARRSEVRAASLVIGSPFRTAMSVDLTVPGWDSLPKFSAGGPFITAVGPDYFRTAGTRLLRGRLFTPLEGASSVHTAIVNETMARTLWPHGDAIGKCLLIGGLKQCATVVGVSEDAHRFRIREEPAMQYYVPLGQQPGASEATILVRPRGAPESAIDMVRQTVAGMAPGARYVDVAALQDRVDPQTRTWRLGAAMFGVFGLLAVIVAASGLYSVIGYLVTQRTREFGVRIAVGATTANIVGLVVRYGLSTVAAGLVMASAIALALGQKIGPQLFDESAYDPRVYAAVALLMLVVAAVALTMPAWRAASTDAAAALRQE
jgi:predicted permease